MEIIKWIQEWYKSQCNGDWEHSYGLLIETVDNPGWFITIDLDETVLSVVRVDSGLVEKSEEDWYFYKIENAKYKASGDPSKLAFLLERFKEIVENNG